MSNAPPPALISAITPVLSHAGFEVVLCEFLAGPRVLRLFIDRLPQAVSQQSAPTVTVEDCSKISRLVSDIIDGEGLLASLGRYSLEVSSPGLDRPLVTPAHFARFVGHRVEVRLRRPHADLGRRLSAKLSSADTDGVTLALKDHPTPLMVRYDSIERARLTPEF